MVDWQAIASTATTLALIVAIGMFILEIRSNRKERAFGTFLRLFDFYGNLMAERRRRWGIIKEKVRANPKISKEVGDKTSSLDYLQTRVQQAEPFYAIEHGLLEDEISSLNLLDALCKYALKDEQMALILKVCYSSEISFYQNRLKDILSIRDKEGQFRLFTMPRYSHLPKLRVGGDYFEDLSETMSNGH